MFSILSFAYFRRVIITFSIVLALESALFSEGSVASPKRLMRWDQLPNRHGQRFSANDLEFYFRGEVHPAIEVTQFQRNVREKLIALGVEVPERLVIDDAQIAQRIVKSYLKFTGQQQEDASVVDGMFDRLKEQFQKLLGLFS